MLDNRAAIGYNGNMKYDVIIIGGGASGIACAIMLARDGKKTAVIEAKDRVLKKVLASGNGRCNLSNVAVDASRYNAPDFVGPVLRAFSGKTEPFFNSLGLELTEEDGRIYPYSLSATNVVNALVRGAADAGAEIKCGEKAEKVVRDGKYFAVTTDKGVYYCEKLVFAAGQNATSGTDCLSMLAHFGHTVTERYPAISHIPSKSVKGASGVRARAGLKLLAGRDCVFDKRGELLFKDNALSGILAFEASSYYVRALRKEQKCIGFIDFVPERSEEEITRFLSQCGCDCETALCAYLHKSLAAAVAKTAGATGKAANDARRLAKALKNYEVTFDGVSDMKNAQVVSGGLALDGFDPVTLESEKTEGLYVTGEALDVDGDSGGFNLHWAWASAYTVAKAIIGGADVQA